MNKKGIAVGVLVAAVAAAYPTYRTMTDTPPVMVDSQAQAQKISQYAHAESFVTPVELHHMMDAKKDVVVIGSLQPSNWRRPIKGSFTVWRPDYSAAKEAYKFGGMRNSKKDMEQLLSSFGATPDSTIVVYAANKHHDAARLYWQIKMLGHRDVRYLDGGLNAWVGADLPTGNANPSVAKTNYSAPAYSEAELADFDMVVRATKDDGWVVLDTRAKSEHDGSKTKSGAAGPGTIPNSVFLEWTKAMSADKATLKSAGELKALYGDLINGKNVIVYCQSGVRSAHTTMVLKEVLGAENVYNYDGSWIEWSYKHYTENNPQAPVVNGKG